MNLDFLREKTKMLTSMNLTALSVLVIFFIFLLIPPTIFGSLARSEINQELLLIIALGYSAIVFAVLMPIILIIFAYNTQKILSSFLIGVIPHVVYSIIFLNPEYPQFDIAFYGVLLGAIGMSAGLIKKDKRLGTILLLTTSGIWLVIWFASLTAPH